MQSNNNLLQNHFNTITYIFFFHTTHISFGLNLSLKRWSTLSRMPCPSHIPCLAIVRFTFPFRFSHSRTHGLEYVLPSEPQTGWNISVHTHPAGTSPSAAKHSVTSNAQIVKKNSFISLI